MVDPNIPVYAADQGSTFPEPARRLRDQGEQEAVALAVSPQVLLECFAVSTDPQRVQPARPSQEAWAGVEQ